MLVILWLCFVKAIRICDSAILHQLCSSLHHVISILNKTAIKQRPLPSAQYQAIVPVQLAV